MRSGVPGANEERAQVDLETVESFFFAGAEVASADVVVNPLGTVDPDGADEDAGSAGTEALHSGAKADDEEDFPASAIVEGRREATVSTMRSLAA